MEDQNFTEANFRKNVTSLPIRNNRARTNDLNEGNKSKVRQLRCLLQSIRRRGYLSGFEVSERRLQNQSLLLASSFGYLTRLYQGLIIAAIVAVTGS